MLDDFSVPLNVAGNSAPGRVEVTVTEQKAPTIESVKLLMEMEAAAMKNLLDRIPFPSNILNGKIVRHLSIHTGIIQYYIQFQLNGKTCSFREDVPDFETEESQARIIESKFAAFVAREILCRLDFDPRRKNY